MIVQIRNNQQKIANKPKITATGTSRLYIVAKLIREKKIWFT